MVRNVEISSVVMGNKNPFILIAGPCMIENDELVFNTADRLREITDRLDIPFIFKSSYDKANRTSVDSPRGPGLEKGLSILARVKEKLEIPVTSDVHETSQVEKAADVLDLIQIPAFLCRQTDLLVAAGRTGLPVNIKKGQFMAPEDMVHAVRKVESTRNDRVIVTERGTTFGYHNLVVDMRSLRIIREQGIPVIFDATHSVQRPAAMGSSTGGDRQSIPFLSRAAVAAGIDGLFMEVHPDPDKALSDGTNMWPLDDLENILKTLKAIDQIVKES